MRRIIVSLLGFLMVTCVFAQKTDSTVTQRTVEIGLHAGYTTGIGLSLRYWPNKLGVQLTCLPARKNNETYINAGLTGLYSFYHLPYFRFFGYLGGNLIIGNHPPDMAMSGNGPFTNAMSSQTPYRRTTKYNIGFGPGIGFGTIVRINLMVGYGVYDVAGVCDILPTAEMGLYYRF